MTTVDWDKAAKDAMANLQKIITHALSRPLDKDILMGNPISADNVEFNRVVNNLYEARDDRDMFRRKAKELGKQLGKAGQTIHNLRADLALLRTKDWNQVGDMYLKQRRDNDELQRELTRLNRENGQLRYQLNQESKDALTKMGLTTNPLIEGY